MCLVNEQKSRDAVVMTKRSRAPARMRWRRGRCTLTHSLTGKSSSKHPCTLQNRVCKFDFLRFSKNFASLSPPSLLFLSPDEVTVSTPLQRRLTTAMVGRNDWATASASLVKWASSSSGGCSTRVMQAWRTSRPRWDMQQQRRPYHDYLRVNTAGGSSARIPLKDGRSGGVFGSATTRGSRPTQEDTFKVACVHIDPTELRHSLQTSKSRVLQEAGRRWDPVYAGEDDAIAGQVVWFGCFDGCVSGRLQLTV